jgi:hypothetical protein
MTNQQPALVTVLKPPFTCRVCDGRQFWERAAKLNSTGAEFLGFGWANKSARAVICAACGFIHEFTGDALELWTVEGGYPPVADAVADAAP